jgi:CheY-like chemotaxis protein
MTEQLEPVALVVDDNQLNSGLAGHMLKRLGWRSACAASGEEALRMLAEQHFDLVLLDLRMPAMSGEEVCRRIRSDLGNTSLPVVAYTAHGMPEERSRMLQAGFNGLLIKPISFDDVRRVCKDIGLGFGLHTRQAVA